MSCTLTIIWNQNFEDQNLKFQYKIMWLPNFDID
jgi:hypothetical protein